MINNLTVIMYKHYPDAVPSAIKDTIKTIVTQYVNEDRTVKDNLEYLMNQVSSDPRGKLAQSIVLKAESNSTDKENLKSAPNSNSTQEEFKTYLDSENKFSVKYPANWKVLEEGLPGSHIEGVENAVAFLPPGEIATSNGFTAFVEIMISHNTPDDTLKTFLQSNIRDILSEPSLSNLRLEKSNTDGLLSGQPAFVMSYTVDRTVNDGVITVVVKEIGTKVSDDFYYIDYVAIEDRANKYLTDAQKIVESFRLLK